MDDLHPVIDIIIIILLLVVKAIISNAKSAIGNVNENMVSKEVEENIAKKLKEYKRNNILFKDRKPLVSESKNLRAKYAKIKAYRNRAKKMAQIFYLAQFSFINSILYLIFN